MDGQLELDWRPTPCLFHRSPQPPTRLAAALIDQIILAVSRADALSHSTLANPTLACNAYSLRWAPLFARHLHCCIWASLPGTYIHLSSGCIYSHRSLLKHRCTHHHLCRHFSLCQLADRAKIDTNLSLLLRITAINIFCQETSLHSFESLSF